MIKTNNKNIQEEHVNIIEDVTLPLSMSSSHEARTVLEELPVSQALRNARLEKGLEQSKIADELRISKTYLEAIEDANLEALPERVYTLGFVRSYARYLGFDAEDVVSRFKSDVLGVIPARNYSMPQPVQGNALPKRSLVYGTTLAVLLCAFAGWYYFNKDSESLERKTEVPEVIKAELTAGMDTDSGASAQSASALSPGELPPQDVLDGVATQSESLGAGNTDNPSPGQIPQAASPSITAHSEEVEAEPVASSTYPESRISLNFTEPSWVELREEKGHVILNHTFRKGDSYVLHMKPGMRFTTGNAGGIQVVTDKEHPFFLGKKGEILKNLPYDAERLKHP